MNEILPNRIGKFGLQLAEDKTRLIKFGRFAQQDSKPNKPETFDFLGFTHYCSTSKDGKFRVKRKTARKKFKTKIKEFNIWLKENRMLKLKDECDFDYTQPLKDIKLMDETRGLISMICLNYWCENEEQKNNFIKHLNENEIRHQEELRKKYNIDDIFYKKENSMRNEITGNIDTNILPVQAEKENILKKIWNCIMKIFHIKNK